MLQNTRERTVFAFQPKRLPKDVDRLRFFQGSIVRKKSLGPRGDTDDEESAKVNNIEDGSRRGQTQTSEYPDGQNPVRSARTAFRSASVNDLRTTVLNERERKVDEGSTSAKDPSPRRLHTCVSMSSMPSARRSEVPPPLPAFPGAWKIQAPLGNQTDRGASAEAKRSEEKPQAVAAAGKALFAAALEESEPVQKTGMLRSPSMPLPRRPSVPREKRRWSPLAILVHLRLQVVLLGGPMRRLVPPVKGRTISGVMKPTTVQIVHPVSQLQPLHKSRKFLAHHFRLLYQQFLPFRFDSFKVILLQLL